uniref:SCO2322 family protein n=1 Tax=Streptomyces bohaiensis TaxID=1431344 RepID=UPI0030C68F21
MRSAVPGARWPARAPAAAALLVLAAGAAPASAAPVTAAAASPAAPTGYGGEPGAAGLGRDAPTGYRYWSFWLRDTADTADTADGTDEETDGGPDESWRYATEGPGTLRPADGAVLGFRFGIGTGTGGAEQPRPTDTFAAVCDATEAGADERRVALVLDFGTRDEAPPGEVPPPPATVCAVVADGATGAETLAAVAGPLRYDRAGLLCAIRGYPERGCGEQASAAPQDSAGAEGGDEGGSTGAGED